MTEKEAKQKNLADKNMRQLFSSIFTESENMKKHILSICIFLVNERTAQRLNH
jgi:hypothetical protein